MRDGLDAVGLKVAAGQDREHARNGQRPRAFDVADARMRVLGTQDRRVGLAGQIDVVDVATLTTQQARVLEAQDRLTDTVFAHDFPRTARTLRLVDDMGERPPARHVLLDAGAYHGQLAFVMPVVSGESLHAPLAHEGQLPVEGAGRITREEYESANR